MRKLLPRSTVDYRGLSAAVWQMADVVVITDREGVIEYVNQAFTAVTGYEPADVIGRTPRVLKSGLHSQGFYQRMWNTLLTGHTFRDVVVNRRKNGEQYYEEKCVTPLTDKNGRISHFISTGRDVTARIERQERLEHLAYHDVLTGLPNRALFLDRLHHAIASAQRRVAVFAVLFIDLDGFKGINDRLGHEVGDKLLRVIAGRLRATVRDTDTPVRLGGDEFGVVLEDVAAAGIVSAAAKIREALAAPVTVSGCELAVTASVGVSVYPYDGSDASTLVRNADNAMYRAKELGKDRTEFCRAGAAWIFTAS